MSNMAKKGRKQSKIPDQRGKISVNIPFNGGTKVVRIGGVCADPMTLSGKYHSRSEHVIKSFMSGFEKFLQ